MDIGTLFGIIGGLGLIVGSILVGGSLGAFIDIPSVLVVIGGTMAATLVMFPLAVVLKTFKVAMKTFLGKSPNPDDIIQEIVNLAEVGRKEGLVALEKVQVGNEFLKKGVRMVADGSTPGMVRAVLETEINNMKLRHIRGQGVFKGMGSMAPAFGMIGTLIGLVQMLQTLNDPAAIGPAMAVALLTTFYGAVLANLFFIPMAKKLEERSGEEAHYMEIIQEGIISIQNGEHPQVVKEKLHAFLSPALRK